MEFFILLSVEAEDNAIRQVNNLANILAKQRQSIEPTYNSLETGDRFTIEARENHRRLLLRSMPDPFVHHTVHVRGWRNALRVLLRRYTYTVIVGGDREIIEDVCELDDNYKGWLGSTRRAEWDAAFERGLHEA